MQSAWILVARRKFRKIGRGEILRDGGDGQSSLTAHGLSFAQSGGAPGDGRNGNDGWSTHASSSRGCRAAARSGAHQAIDRNGEGGLSGGRVGSAIIELLEENGLQDKVRVVRMGIPDTHVTHGDAKLLLAKYGLDTDGIFTRVKACVEQSRREGTSVLRDTRFLKTT